ncbi:M48 family metallopeptidase [Candidatus Uhrbacteria bacterium]|nr:M48 family metallopeptidase [Candidatus Uhrbacteria bacterium]
MPVLIPYLLRRFPRFRSFRIRVHLDGRVTVSQLPRLTHKDYLRHKEAARALVIERIGYFNHVYGFPFNNIFIKNQKTCWGSCSKNKNLNFNYKIAFLPPRLADYIMVHELCHLQEMNHSKRFWMLVVKTIPDHTIRRRALKTASPSRSRP